MSRQSLVVSRQCFIIILLAIAIFSSCQKDSFITSPDASFSTSVDTLHFDTVFITAGSITQSFKIFNPNNQKLLLSSVQLMGGVNSYFKMNVDGSPGASFSNITIDANDSLYVFVSININPSAANLPFIVQDSILISYNGNQDFVQLDAYGQNAQFLNGVTVTRDTTWTNNLPIVLLGGLTVNPAATLTIKPGTKIYCHANSAIMVGGTLNAIGGSDPAARILFTGDRLDAPYNAYPGGWPGISFNTSSINDVLTYCSIQNGYEGIVATNPATNAQPKVTLNQCVINNIYDAGINAGFTSIEATNCLISNCGGSNIYIYAGGTYQFTNCTAASYSTLYVEHTNPVLSISNIDGQNNTYDLAATFTNSIFYGGQGSVTSEIVTNQQGANAFSAAFQNCLYLAATPPANAAFNNCIANQDPLFDTIDVVDNYYSFHLQPASPCIGAGLNTGLTIDLDGNPRMPPLDIGCYQHQ